MVQLLPLRRRGETSFVTLTLIEPDATTLVDEIEHLQGAVRIVRDLWPFEVDAWVVLPDHLHAVLTLPFRDGDLSIRLSTIKARFAACVSKRAMTPSQIAAGGAHLWSPHDKIEPIRTRAEMETFRRHCWTDPVRHGFVSDPHDWPCSSYHRNSRTDPRNTEPLATIRASA
ncbi:transposase [Roseovarius sp. SK2]|jgi:putative transposase|uniref:REP-associated tyrosine transposase n=1 Tax=Roseovarius TaxID=74030 RepID=UPI000CDD9D53|nr:MULTISPECIES: transposase [Roseovarius]MDD9723972.1 transposase [Roseovarius sp. SK2]